MHSFADALNLIDYSKAEFNVLKVEYARSTEHKKITIDLPAKIKNFLENLRSSLDFCTHNLYEKFGDHTNPPKIIYFPYAWMGATEKEFVKKVEICLPGIQSSRPDILALLNSYQYYYSPANAWLPQFMELTNGSNHTKLTLQTVNDVEQLEIDPGVAATRLFIRGGGVIDMGANAAIRSKYGSISGEQSINLGSSMLKNIQGNIKGEMNMHTAIFFESNNEEVIFFLESVLERVSSISNDLASVH
ncbi:MAG: hypothetical protein H7122_15125 [Chitinophagaceae bacterium]|nr:hypothetical protein [Chitinophagaceae bacterium]